jgi:hypothetical protein
MSGTGSRLAKRYRSLLLSYPRDYRRERGQEIVDTFLDLAPSGRGWPTARQAANLVRHGLRCRLGRAASRSVVVWATLTAIVCGLFVAAFAMRVAWETASPLPDEAQATAIFATVLPDEDLHGRVDRSPAMFVVYGQPLDLQQVDVLLYGDGGEYGFGATSASLTGPTNERRAPGVLTQRLRSNGWEVAEPRETLPMQSVLTARRGSDIIEIEIYPNAGNDDTNVIMSLQRATPWAAYPISLIGGLLGAAIGWLVFGWASWRTETGPAVLRAGTKVLYGLALFLWWLPIGWAAPFMLAHHLRETHMRWHPLWEWLGQPAASLPFVWGAGLALLALAVAMLPRRTPDHARDLATH